MSFTWNDLNETLFDRVACFDIWNPSGMGGPGAIWMYTEDGMVFQIGQEGFEADWYEIDRIFPFRDTRRYRQYNSSHIYIRPDLHDALASAMEAYRAHYWHYPVCSQIIWQVLSVPEDTVRRIVYDKTAAVLEREAEERRERDEARKRIKLTADDMEWRDFWYIPSSEDDHYAPNGCYTALYKRNDRGGIEGTMWFILFQVQEAGTLYFDEERRLWACEIEAYNIFWNRWRELHAPLSYPPPAGGEAPTDLLTPGRFFCSCRTLGDAKKRVAVRNGAIGWGDYTKENRIVPTRDDWN